MCSISGLALVRLGCCGVAIDGLMRSRAACKHSYMLLHQPDQTAVTVNNLLTLIIDEARDV